MKGCRLAGVLPALAVVMSVLASAGGAALAQSGGLKAAEDVLRQGIEAQSKRRHDIAIRLISDAVNSGALQRRQLALALYRRAISFRAAKQPAQAISDLNSALFFKDDLTDKDRAEAIELRLHAYRDAGLEAPKVSTTTARAPSSAAVQAPGGAVASGPRIITTEPPRVSAPLREVTLRESHSNLPPTAPILAPEPSPTVARAAHAAPARDTKSAAAPIPPFQTETRLGASAGEPSVPAFATATVPNRVAPPPSTWSTATAPRAASAYTAPVAAPPSDPAPWSSTARPAPAARASVVGGATRNLTAAPAMGSRPYEAPPQVAAAPPAAAAPVAATGIGGFFSTLFGQDGTGSSQTATAPREQRTASAASAPTTTGTVTRFSAAVPAAASTPPTARNATREVETVAAVPLAAPAVPLASAPASAPVVRPAEPRARRYDIEIVALHDKYRAEAIAKQIMVEFSTDFMWSSRKTRVDEKPGAGEDGMPLYAVRLGIYDDAKAARAFCAKLEDGGHNCEVVARE